MEQKQIFIIVSGGIVQDVISNDPDVQKQIYATVIDYDVEGCDADVNVRQADGSLEPAAICDYAVGPADIGENDLIDIED